MGSRCQSLNGADADLQNNLGRIELFVGRLPTPVATEPTGMTQDTIFINASEASTRTAVRSPWSSGCRSTTGRGRGTTSASSLLCTLNYTWIDDGVYPVEITVEDEERDESVMILNVTVENRAPKIEVRSQRTEAKVEYPITLYAYANDSDSEKVWPGVVDIYWPEPTEEGYYTRCTTTSNVEGLKTFTAVGTDDDSATTSATFESQVHQHPTPQHQHPDG